MMMRKTKNVSFSEIFNFNNLKILTINLFFKHQLTLQKGNILHLSMICKKKKATILYYPANFSNDKIN